MSQALPTFREIADTRIQEARLGTRTINVKVAINTARMMVEAEDKSHRQCRALAEMLEMLTDSHARLEQQRGSAVGTLTDSARRLLREVNGE